jgi:hypothetical protein
MRLPPTAAVAAAALVLAPVLAACGSGSGSSGACGPIRREALDQRFLTHVLGDAHVEYTSHPPTSGPHQPTPELPPVITRQIAEPVQVGVLEAGDVLIQHRDDLSAKDRGVLEGLAGKGVHVAPNPDLPAAVVATAWLYKRTCSAVDADALREFVDERRDKAPGSDAP